jgi:ADP-ribosylglycohydrolase
MFDQTHLASHPQIDRILGCIYGQALGDAFGLATEFECKPAIALTMYPKLKQIPFPLTYKTSHNKRWIAGDWTDDTDQMILIMNSITDTLSTSKSVSSSHSITNDTTTTTATADAATNTTGSAVTKEDIHKMTLDFAKKLLYWIHHGFPELGDNGGMGLGALVSKVVLGKDTNRLETRQKHQQKYLCNPFECSRRVFIDDYPLTAANGSLMRTSILACYHPENLPLVEYLTTSFGIVTHFDPRCVASCVLATRILAQLITGTACTIPPPTRSTTALTTHDEKSSSREKTASSSSSASYSPSLALSIEKKIDVEHLIDEAASHVKKDLIRRLQELLHVDPYTMLQEIHEFETHISPQSLNALRLDDLEKTANNMVKCGKKIGYVYKCLGAGLYALRAEKKNPNQTNAEFFRQVINEITMEGGDADTNCALAGAFLGARLGYSNLPQDMLQKLPHKKWLDNHVMAFLKATGRLLYTREKL